MTTLYGIPHCDTVKKARAWLHTHGVTSIFVDVKKAGIPSARLAAWTQALGWEKLLNRQGTTWRKLDAATQASVVDAASAQALLQAQPSCLKRPVVEWSDGSTTIGFSPEVWQKKI